jgi:hypothetical protein
VGNNVDPECRKPIDALKEKKLKKCQRKSRGKQECEHRVEAWYKKQIANKCLPCEDKVNYLYEIKH